MATTVLMNLAAAIFIVAALAGVCRLAHRVADGLLDPAPRPRQLPAAADDERLAA